MEEGEEGYVARRVGGGIGGIDWVNGRRYGYGFEGGVVFFRFLEGSGCGWSFGKVCLKIGRVCLVIERVYHIPVRPCLIGVRGCRIHERVNLMIKRVCLISERVCPDD